MKNLSTFALIITSFALFAQTGPGGVGNSTNNVVWLDGNVVSIGTHPKIATWPDQSGNSINFSQGSQSLQPTTIGYGFVKAVRFNGSNYIVNGGSGLLNSNLNTQFIVYHGGTANHDGVIYQGSYSQSGSFQTTFRTSSGNVTSRIRNSSLGVINNTTTNSAAFQIINSLFDGNAQTFTTYKDGFLIGTQIGADGNPTGNYQNIVGAAFNGTYRLNGDVGEIVSYNKVLNSAERNIVTNYLASKFNLTINNDLFLFDNTTFHRYQLIGVGGEIDGSNLVAQGKGIVQLTAGTLNNGDYVMIGHNNVNLNTMSANVPVQAPAILRLDRTWRADITGSPGAVDLSFELNNTGLEPNSNYYLLLDADGDFSSGATSIAHTSYNGITNTVTFSGVTINDGVYIAIAAENNFIVSKANGNWNNPATWSCNCIPAYGQNAKILNGHTVSLNNINCFIDTLIINAGGVLKSVVSTYFLNLKGNLHINGSVNGTISINTNGTVPQQFLNNNTGTAIDLYYVYSVNPNIVTFNNGLFNIHNRARNFAGFIEAGPASTVTFVSNASYTAIIHPSTTGFGFLGDFTMQRYIAPSIDDWSDMASPVQFTTIADWDNELYMSGVFGNDGNAGPFQSVWSYDNPSQQFVAITSTATPINPGYGIEMWLADTLGAWYGGTFNSIGTPNTGNLTISAPNLGSTIGDWNLLGNPYQSWIKWNAVTKSNLKNEIWIYDHTISNYTLVSGSNVQIPPSQGFWAENSGSSASVTFTEGSKNPSSLSSSFYRNGGLLSDSGEFVLKLKGINAPYAHNAYFRLNADASEFYNAELDAKYLKSKNKRAHSITIRTKDNMQVSLKTINSYQETSVIPVEVRVSENGIYQIDALKLDNLQEHFNCILLKNKINGEIIDLKSTPYFTFEVSDATKVYAFELVLSNNSDACRTASVVADNSSVTFTPFENNVLITTDFAKDENVFISITNLLGQEIVSNKTVNTSAKNHSITTEGLSGVYIITLKSSMGVHSKKVVLY
jgi:hypothetical protein